MAPTLEDLDRRVTALELAQSAKGENAIARLEQKVDAIPRVTAELIAELRAEMRAEMNAIEQRLSDRIGTTERRFTDLLNERFDAVMTALDRRHNPPR
jgi:hypothetical protein